MALRFNPPPNWPKPPEGFIPQPGWQPDPAWGPAPDGWVFWVEENTADDATRVLPTDGIADAAATEQPADQSVAPAEQEAPVVEPVSAEEPAEQPAPVEAAQAETPVAPIENTSGGLNLSKPSDSEPAPAQETEATTSFESAPQEDPTEAFASDPIPPQNPYTEAGQANAAPSYSSSYNQPAAGAPTPGLQSPGTQPSSYPQYNAQGNSAQNGAAQNSYSQSNAPQVAAEKAPAKKPNKTLWFIIGGVAAFLLIIILIISLIVGMLRSDSTSTNTSNDTSITQQDNGSDTWSNSGNSSSGDFVRKNNTGETKTYEGTGEKTIDIEKPGGSDSTAWFEYSYEPADKYDSFRIESQDSSGSANDTLVTYYASSNNTDAISGSAFLDGRWGYQDPSTKLKIVGEGKWKIVIHPLADAPVKKAGDTMNGAATQAFIVEGDDVTADVKLEDSSYSIHFNIDKLPDDLEDDDFVTLMSTDASGFEGSIKLDSGKHLYQAETSGGSKWEITLK